MIPTLPLTRANALRYGAYYVARLLPHPFLRGRVAAAIRAFVNARNGEGSGAQSTESKGTLKTLRDSGIAPVGGVLSLTQIDEALSYLAAAPVARGSSDPVTVNTQGVASAEYDLPTILACPHLLSAMNHPGLLQIASGFFGCKPTLSGVGLRWSFPSGQSASIVQQFHRDTEDWRILRVFVYLTDVNHESGPHQFVQESHKTAGRLRLRPYTDQHVDQQFGRDKVVTITGPKGTSFMADMWGVHRGIRPAERPRLLFNFTYTMTATPIYRYHPVEVPDSHLYDRYTNRLLIC
jgi:hypothetical protein